jgi:oligo-alginate lyase
MKNVLFTTVFLLILAVLPSPAQENGAITPSCLTDEHWKKLPAHPRLYANAARFTKLKTQKDDVSKQLLALLKKEADKAVLAEKIVYPSTGFKFGAMRTVQGRILALALAYRVFGEKRYLERAKAELIQLAELPDWCPSHFLDVGEGALAAGIGLDWLYDELTPAEREKITGAIKNNALLPSLALKTSTNNTSWVNGNFNWNPVCHGGLSVAALAIAENEPALAHQIVERAIRYVPMAGEAYAPDGSFPEGPSYWSYGTSFYVILIEALRSGFGTACDLEKLPGFLKTADYNNQMVGATGIDFNYSDYHVENLNEPIMLWFAREQKRPDLIRDEVTDIGRLYEAPSKDQPGKNVVASRHLPLEILWWDPSLLKNRSLSPPPLHWTAGGLLPMVVIRSAWDDPNASFIALKGGTPNNSHGHMDAGSFVLEANGVRWALDLGTEDYNKMRAAKLDLWNYSQTSSRWTTFRCGPESHNIPRFNNAYQDISGLGLVRALPDEKGVKGDIADLSSLYRAQVEHMSRTVKMHPDRSISLQDDWKTGPNAVDYVFQWITAAKATLIPEGVLLEQNGTFLKLHVEIPNSGLRPEIVIEDVSAPKNPQDSPNPGISRLLIRLKTPANSVGTVKVTAIPKAH